MTISIQGIFTIENYYFAKPKYISGNMNYVNLIRGWINSKDIVRLIIADDRETKINDLFFVESLDFNENSKSNGDVNYTIVLREYRPLDDFDDSVNKNYGLNKKRK